jgi:hypothetical protein
VKASQIRDRSKLRAQGLIKDERQKLYQSLLNWGRRYAWFREDLP